MTTFEDQRGENGLIRSTVNGIIDGITAFICIKCHCRVQLTTATAGDNKTSEVVMTVK